ncbi:Trk K+ transport system, NAD-binding component [Halogranum amylolyticum]|uniref:Trk K+ transport system, NAD-binding component n=1 Tax=Halogranum amylolyticum TaxID=660520 RepID=A0A1H8UZZ8_9EURY|nr:NAD-binding protein [Halogranum amylolyticum]SEP08138.1 Trk K+ transport system, NAD-binding component [Halogranum amylolyticum]
MALRTRRTVYYLALVIVTTLVFTVVYNVGMAIWENRPQPLYHSLEIVIQSFTTTGYGEDAPWRTLQMNLLAIVMQLAGIGLILTAVDVFAVPWLRDALSPMAPETVHGLDGHIIICGHTPRTDVLIEELDARDREYVLIEPDADIASSLHEAEYNVIHGDPESTDVLENAQISSAIAIVADAADDTNASIALSALEINPNVRIISLIEDAALARYHQLAGADTVLSPRQLLGESLAGEVPTAVTATVEEGVEIGDDFELVELSVEEGSDLCDKTFAEAQLRERFGANVIGVWFNGNFKTPIDPNDELDAGTRLLVAGESDQLDMLRDATAATVSKFSAQEIIIAGYGDTGQAAYEALMNTSSRLTVLDIEEKEHTDVVGDARDPDVLEAAGIEEASVLLLAVEDDTTAIFATLIARDLNSDLQIVVRANEEEDVQKLYRAGADYVQSLATVSGRMLASTVFEDEDLLVYDKQVSVVRLPAPSLEGRTLVDEEVRTVTGCTVVAIVRDGESITDFDPERFRLEATDEVVIAGTDENITRFERRFGAE